MNCNALKLKPINFEDALRKVINDFEEDLFTFCQRTSVDFYDLFGFLNEGEKLKSKAQMDKIRNNLNDEDYEKLLLLLNR